MHKYKSPKISLQNQISFTCSDTAVKNILEILRHLKALGDLGASRSVCVDERIYLFDGDGSDRLNYIKVNGLSLREWEEEANRLDKTRKKREEFRIRAFCEKESGNEKESHNGKD